MTKKAIFKHTYNTLSLNEPFNRFEPKTEYNSKFICLYGYRFHLVQAFIRQASKSSYFHQSFSAFSDSLSLHSFY